MGIEMSTHRYAGNNSRLLTLANTLCVSIYGMVERAMLTILHTAPTRDQFVALNEVRVRVEQRQVWRDCATLTRRVLHCVHPFRDFLEPSLGILKGT